MPPGAPAVASTTGTIPDLPVARVTGLDVMLPGRWTGVKGGSNTYSPEDTAGAVEAFHELRAAGFQPVVKLGHSPEQALLQSAGLPNAGILDNCYMDGDRLKVDLDRVPAKVAALIKAGAYGPRSLELLMGAEFAGKKYPLVIKNLALLGDEQPAVNGLNDILALYSAADDDTVEVALSVSADDTVTVELAAPTAKEGEPQSPPKGYPEEKNADNYADPANYSWPIDTAARTRSAMAYFNAGKGKDKYSADEWATIGKRIASAANKYFGPGHSLKDGQITSPDKEAQMVAADAGEADEGDPTDRADTEGQQQNAAHLDAMQQMLTGFGQHLDGLKGKAGVGPTRAMHRELSSKVKQLRDRHAPDVPPGQAHEPPAAAPESTDARNLSREEESMTDEEIRALLDIPESQDLKHALLSLKGQTVELSAHQAVVAELEGLRAEKETLLAAENKRNAEVMVDRAIDAGKLAAKQRDWAVNRATVDRADFEMFLAVAPTVWAGAGEVGSGSGGIPGNAPSQTVLTVAKKLGVSEADLADQRSTAQKYAELLEKKQAAVAGSGAFGLTRGG